LNARKAELNRAVKELQVTKKEKLGRCEGLKKYCGK
jgi:hypothetical protein